MNNTKCMALIACSLMMSVALYGMKLEKLNEPCISKDNIFVWSPKDRQYHEVTELGEVSEGNILQKNDQPHKIYKALLVIKGKKEGEEGNKCFLNTTQEFAHFYTGDKFINLDKDQRVLVPISFFSKQYDTIMQKFRHGRGNQEMILTRDNDNNVYFITDVCIDREPVGIDKYMPLMICVGYGSLVLLGFLLAAFNNQHQVKI